MNIEVRKMKVLGTPVGNLWQVKIGDIWYRCSYLGNKLMIQRGGKEVPAAKEIEVAIEKSENTEK